MVNLGSERLLWPSLPFPFLLHRSRRWCTGASEDIARLSRDDLSLHRGPYASYCTTHRLSSTTTDPWPSSRCVRMNDSGPAVAFVRTGLDCRCGKKTGSAPPIWPRELITRCRSPSPPPSVSPIPTPAPVPKSVTWRRCLDDHDYEIRRWWAVRGVRGQMDDKG